MSEFKVIETQEQLDAVLSDRLKREKATLAKQYEGYLSPEAAAEKYKGYLTAEQAAEKYKGYLSPEDAAKKDAKIKGYEISSVKMKIAHERGIPFELVNRLSGETEEEIRRDAEALAKFVSADNQPLAGNNGGDQESTTDAAYRKVAQKIK